jgi:dipeptidyl aminopeptidase/acylaminoacyl peptidase
MKLKESLFHRTIFIVLLLRICNTQAQEVGAQNIFGKQVIDSEAIHRWVRLDSDINVAITADGKYFTYRVANQPFGRNTLIIQTTDGTWKKEYIDAKRVIFSNDSKLFVFHRSDSLYFLELGTGIIKTVGSVSSFKQVSNSLQTKDQWLAWQIKGKDNELVLYNISTSSERLFKGVKSYYFNENGDFILLHISNENVGAKESILQLVSLSNGEIQFIYGEIATDIKSITMDADGNQIAFMTELKGTDEFLLWYYKKGIKKAIVLVTNKTAGIRPGHFMKPVIRFSQDGRYIYLSLFKKEFRQPKDDFVNLNVWSYKDTVIQSFQVRNQKTSIYWMDRSYVGVISVALSTNKKVVYLTGEYEILAAWPRKGDFTVIRNISNGDRFWMQTDTNWIVSLIDGSRQFLRKGYIEFNYSPNGEFLVYYDPLQQHIFSYELETGKKFNLTSTLPAGNFGFIDEYERGKKRHWDLCLSVGIAGWLQGEKEIIVYDNYDLWRLNLQGKHLPVNITNGYGQKHKIKFRLANSEENKKEHSKRSTLLLNSFNMDTKYNGFFTATVEGGRDPELLTMEPRTYCHSDLRVLNPNAHEFVQNMEPIKARNKNIWIVKRHSINEAPNYFLTKDFKNYKELTSFQPQKPYNWVTGELIHWKQLDDTKGQGVLYKPENFDSTKKYPLVICYYEQLSHRLFEYPYLDFTSSAHLNIPWFVSQGYLLFTPDIYFDGEKTGQSAYNSVVSAAKSLSKLSFVDSQKIGIAGHSFAGGLTNYLVTNTNIFAAAFEGAGVSDYVSEGLQLGGDGGSRLNSHEHADASLWQQPDLYTIHSPIMNVHKVITPLLMFHCRKDGAVPWEQAVEFFVALRRIGKRAWLLEYENGNHELNGKDAEDLTIRVTQFFNYYLKSREAPVWMTNGIPARLKGIDTGLQFEESTRKP